MNNIAILVNLSVFSLILNFKTYTSELMITVPENASTLKMNIEYQDHYFDSFYLVWI